MVQFNKKVRILITSVLFFCMSACTTIQIKEQSFLKDQKQTILYQLTLNGPQSQEDLEIKTGYTDQIINKQLVKLNEKGMITKVKQRWEITEKYVMAQDDYVESIQKFDIKEQQKKLNHHTLSTFFVPNTSIYAASFIAKKATTTLIIYGGNGFNIIPDIKEVARVMLAKNRNVFVMNYPGMGDSPEKTTIDSIKNSALDFFNYVSNHPSSKGTNIVVYGFSLGGFVASDIASKNQLDGLILDSTAPDMQSWIDANVPFYAAPFIDIKIAKPLIQVSNKIALKEVKCPILFLGGDEDKITPVDMIQVLADSSTKAVTKTIFIFDGVGHGGTPDHPKFQSTISKFIQSLKAND